MSRHVALISLMLSLTACIERINFNVDNVGGSNALLVIDGNITDRPGPYTVRIFRALNVDDDLRKASPFSKKSYHLRRQRNK